jgi:hypothetical protein
MMWPSVSRFYSFGNAAARGQDARHADNALEELSMTSIQGRHGEASPECFLVTADGLVQSVLRRYYAAAEERARNAENEIAQAATTAV